MSASVVAPLLLSACHHRLSSQKADSGFPSSHPRLPLSPPTGGSPLPWQGKCQRQILVLLDVTVLPAQYNSFRCFMLQGLLEVMMTSVFKYGTPARLSRLSMTLAPSYKGHRTLYQLQNDLVPDLPYSPHRQSELTCLRLQQ